MILITVQYACDGTGCRKTQQATGNPDTIKDATSRLEEAGWEQRGRKVFCPECAGNLIGGGPANQLGR